MDITVSAAPQTRNISEKLYGIFLEDINYGGDGGLYAELVPNRSFEFEGPNGQDNRLMRWQALGGAKLAIAAENPRGDKNPHYMRIIPAQGECGARSEGYLGEGFYAERHEAYRLTLIGRASGSGEICARITAESGRVLAHEKIELAANWRKYEVELMPQTAGERAYLDIVVSGETELDFVSLFPKHTFMGRANGARADIATALAQLKPAFMRFPGGCIVEGRSFKNMYRWKDSIGPLEERRVNWNRWQLDEYQIEGRSSADYYQSYGMGYFEYMQFCEDIGCMALPVLNCGLTCQWHEALAVPLNDMDDIISDYLDFIEFCNGGADTRWGGVRAAMGHEKPFGLKIIGVGNEQWDQVYFERYELIHKAVKAAHPEIELVGCAGWRDDGWEIDKARAWMKRTEYKPDYSDEHYYKPIEWFLENADRYSDYDANLPAVFAGEYAAHSHHQTGLRRNTLGAAVAEAAFLTGIENASPVVQMSCYAPLLARVGANQWQPDMIWFTQNSVILTPSYYVQQMFACNRGDTLMQCKIDGVDKRAYVTASRRASDGAIILKAVNPYETAISAAISTPVSHGEARCIELSGDAQCENTIEAPQNVHPKERMHSFEGAFKCELAPCSVNVIVIKET